MVIPHTSIVNSFLFILIFSISQKSDVFIIIGFSEHGLNDGDRRHPRIHRRRHRGCHRHR